MLYAGEREALKAAVHCSAGMLAALCLIYNLAALCCRGERHLAWNTLTYGAFFVFEMRQVRRHLRRG